MADSKLNIQRLSSKIKQQSAWRCIPELYGCLFIDMPWLDMLYAFCSLGSFKRYRQVQDEIETLLGGPEKILVSLSVRSSFDLFLQAMNFPPGSELISTCINIKQMASIAEHHKVHLKGVDIDLSNLQPDFSQIESMVTEKTVGIIVVQLFGMKFRTIELMKFTKKHGLVLIQDCAQAFYGPAVFKDVESDIAFFSFGSIKRSTCLGGACIVSENPNVLQKMREIQNQYPIQGRLEYFYKLAKYVIFMFAMNIPTFSWLLSLLFSALGIDYKVFIKARLRSFRSSKFHFLELIRFQPSLPLLMLLKRRMANLLENEECCLDGRLRAEYAICSLIEKPTYVLGCLSELRDFWLFPVLVDNPLEVEEELERQGVSAFSKASSLEFNHKPCESLKSSQFVCKHVLYLPIDKRSPKWHIDNVCKNFAMVVQNRKSILSIAEQEGVQLKRDIKTFLKCSSVAYEPTEKSHANAEKSITINIGKD